MARRHSGNVADSAWLHGLKIVVVAVVAQAVWGMTRNLCPDCERATIAVGAAMVALAIPSAPGQIGALPFSDTLRRRPTVQSVLRGVNAAVVGLLPAALYKPVWTSAILGPADFAIAILAFLLLALWAVPPWLVVIFGAAAASIVAGIPAING